MSPAPLHAREGLTLAYDRLVVAEALDVEIPAGGFTVIVGPNACGKSTLLRALARMLKPRSGTRAPRRPGDPRPALQGGRPPARAAPADSMAPDGITVADLVARGRHPHQSFLRQWSSDDERAVLAALAATASRTSRPAGRRALGRPAPARVARAGARAGDPLLLLDEPTTFLDIAHQIEVLDLCAELHEEGRTLVAVLHDLNQACRYATHLVAMREGRVVARGAPADIVDAELVQRVFGVRCRVMPDPETGTPMIVPAARRPAAVGARSAP